MLKIFLSVMMLSSLMFGATKAKPTGCDLSQDGKVELNILGYGSSKDAHYQAAKKVGKNFKELFIGTKISFRDALVSITDIKANKRDRTLPRTGLLFIVLKLNGVEEKIKMTYMYEQGHFIALGKQKNKREINLSLYIKALLCYSK